MQERHVMQCKLGGLGSVSTCTDYQIPYRWLQGALIKGCSVGVCFVVCIGEVSLRILLLCTTGQLVTALQLMC